MIDPFRENEISDFIPKWLYPTPIQMLTLELTESSSKNIPEVLENYERLISADNLDIRKAWKAVDKRFEQIKGRPHDFYVAGRFEDMFPYLMVRILCKMGTMPLKRDLLTSLERKNIISELRKTGNKFIELLGIANIDFPSAMILAKLAGDENLQFRSRFSKKYNIPDYFFAPVSEVLECLIAAGEKNLNPEAVIVKRPGMEDAKKLYFCRMLSRFFRVWLYSPLYASAAAFATVLLNEVVDAEYVRFAEKGFRQGVTNQD